MGRGGPGSRGPRVCSLTASDHGRLANQGEWTRRGTRNGPRWIPEMGRAACVLGGGGHLRPPENPGTSERK